MDRVGRWVNTAIVGCAVVVCVPLTGVFAVKWLGRDEPNESHACGSAGRSGTCWSGEWANMSLTLVFAAIALLGAVGIVMMIRSGRRPKATGWDASNSSAAERLHVLDALRAAGAISEADYVRQRAQVIADI